jgi:hypothetical protein
MGRGEMPREYVTPLDSPFDAAVSWGKDQEVVQVATVCDGVMPTGAERVLEMVNAWLAEAGLDVIDVDRLKKLLAAKHDGAVPGFSGWHVSITSRRQVNRLIQILRRARDDAMGKDT